MEQIGSYKVSVVTAVYNVEDYLEDMIESIIAQTIGFEKIQLILVDDGSEDGSGQICDRYAVKYPDNIAVIHKVNGGVSSARNEGLKQVKGEYVNFTDADDMLEEKALELMYAYLKENEEKIDLVAIRSKLFGESVKEHPLNYKFEKTKLVDLEKEYSFVQSMINATLIKRECFNDRRFDIGLSNCEDIQVITDILLDKMHYGVVSETRYLYRKRASRDSAVDLSRGKVSYYIPCVEKFILYSLENAFEKKGYIPQFVQYTCMYELQWRLTPNPLVERGVLKKDELEKYKDLLIEALQYIDNNIIVEQNNLKNNYKTAILMLKRQNGGKKEIVLYPNDVRIHIGDYFKSAGASAFEQRYEFISILSDKIIIEGYVRYFAELDNINVILKMQKDDMFIEYIAELSDREDHCSYCLNQVITKAKGFRFNIERDKMSDEIQLQLCIRYEKVDIICKNICFGEFFPLSQQLQNSYMYEEGILLTYIENALRLKKTTDIKEIKGYERLFQEEIQSERDDVSENDRRLRKEYDNLKQNKKDEIWLISDKLTKVDDSSESVFVYMNAEGKRLGIETYFILIADSEDYARLCRIGRVVPFGSTRHKILALLCDKIISPQEENIVFDCFSDKLYLYKDILRQKKFVSLPRDITWDNISKWYEEIEKCKK